MRLKPVNKERGFKVGDRVLSVPSSPYSCYTFDPIIGIVKEKISQNLYSVKVLKGKTEDWKYRPDGTWNYSGCDLKLTKKLNLTPKDKRSFDGKQ